MIRKEKDIMKVELGEKMGKSDRGKLDFVNCCKNKEIQSIKKVFLVKSKKMNIRELCDSFYSYQKNKVKNTTLYTYVQRSKYFNEIENVKLNELTIEHYEIWRNNLENSDLSTSYKNNILKYFKELLNFAEKWYGYDFRNLYNKFDKFREPNAIIDDSINFYTYEEFKKFISVETDLRYKVAFEILYYCGLRRGELLALTWDNIDLVTKKLSVKQNLVENRIEGGYLITSPKTRSSIRTIPMPDILVDDLIRLKEENLKDKLFLNSWFVIGSDRFMPITNLMVRKNLNCKKVGLRQIRLHDFRHSCASLFISKGANVAIVARYLGHTKIDETLNTYTHFFESDLNKIVETLNSL